MHVYIYIYVSISLSLSIYIYIHIYIYICTEKLLKAGGREGDPYIGSLGSVAGGGGREVAPSCTVSRAQLRSFYLPRSVRTKAGQTVRDWE